MRSQYIRELLRCQNFGKSFGISEHFGNKLVATGANVCFQNRFFLPALENMWRAVLPDAKMESGELCLMSGTGQVLPTGSLSQKSFVVCREKLGL